MNRLPDTQSVNPLNHLTYLHPSKVRLREAYSLVDRCMANVSLDPVMAKRFRWDIEHLTTFYPHGLTSDQLRSATRSPP